MINIPRELNLYVFKERQPELHHEGKYQLMTTESVKNYTNLFIRLRRSLSRFD